MKYPQPLQTGVKAVTALPPSCTSPGLTGPWKARNSRTTDYHTAPSLASRCRLMGSWKVKMKKRFLLHTFPSPIFSLHHSAVSDRCHSFCLSGSRFLSSPPRRHKWDCAERRQWESQEEIRQRKRSPENNKNSQVISVKTPVAQSRNLEKGENPLLFLKWMIWHLSFSCTVNSLNWLYQRWGKHFLIILFYFVIYFTLIQVPEYLAKEVKESWLPAVQASDIKSSTGAHIFSFAYKPLQSWTVNKWEQDCKHD